jgi:hypothetical protein
VSVVTAPPDRGEPLVLYPRRWKLALFALGALAFVMAGLAIRGAFGSFTASTLDAPLGGDQGHRHHRDQEAALPRDPPADDEAVLARLPPVKRALMRVNRRLVGSAVNIPANVLPMPWTTCWPRSSGFSPGLARSPRDRGTRRGDRRPARA